MRGAALTVALIAGGHGLAQPAPEPTIDAALDALVASAPLPRARLGVVIVEAATGRVIYQHDPDVPLNPASNAKLLTAAAALSILGAEHRFTTTVHGAVRAGIVSGALVLRGRGDPSLRTADLYDLARQVWLAGARRVEGDLVVDDSYLGTQHLPPAFEQQPRESAAFRAPVSAASVDENAIELYVRPGPTIGAAAFIGAAPRGYLDVENRLVTSEAPSRVAIDLTPTPGGRERVRVTGNVTIGARPETYRRRLDNPSLAVGYAFRAVLAEVGVRVTGSVRVGSGDAESARLASHDSLPLSALLYEVGKDSNNFYAEMLLLAMAAEPTAGAPTTAVTFERGAERALDWAQRAGVNTQGMVARNGSGLYDANRFTARQITQVLRAAWRDPAMREEYVAQLAVAGHDGTLRGRLRAGAERVVRAKTGTLDDAVALSGYVLTADPAQTLVFSFVCNGVRGNVSAARQLADRIVARAAQR